ncbi:MAG: hypothetical protein J6I45_11325, partial [Clostridia bacterium]|nr:hypothetical protein [Clostridia bacterium]
RLSKEISAKNTNCQVGVWCKDCAHVKYDKATVEFDYEYASYLKKMEKKYTAAFDAFLQKFR